MLSVVLFFFLMSTQAYVRLVKRPHIDTVLRLGLDGFCA